MWFDTKCVVLTAGSAAGGTNLNAFDNALRAAKIADFNLIKVTSIVPPGIPVFQMDEQRQPILGRGLMLPTVYEIIESQETGSVISSAVGIGVPIDNSRYSGVIFACSGRRAEDATISILQNMIDEGMREMRLVSEYKFMYASAEAIVQERPTAVFAAAAFCDEHLMALMEVTKD